MNYDIISYNIFSFCRSSRQVHFRIRPLLCRVPAAESQIPVVPHTIPWTWSPWSPQLRRARFRKQGSERKFSVSQNRARTQVLLQARKSHAYGSGTFGALWGWLSLLDSLVSLLLLVVVALSLLLVLVVVVVVVVVVVTLLLLSLLYDCLAVLVDERALSVQHDRYLTRAPQVIIINH